MPHPSPRPTAPAARILFLFRTLTFTFTLTFTLTFPFASSAFAQRGDAPDAKPLPATESQRRFHLPPGFEIQLVAAEPDLEKPFNVAFDAAGRVWVTGSKIYPWPARRDARGDLIATFEQHWGDTGLAFRPTVAPPEPPESGIDTLRVLSDFDPATGRARRSVVFADGLNVPVGVLPLPRAPGAKGDTVLVFSIPAIWRLTDTDGDGKADTREKLYDGFGFKDTHGMSSSYWRWFDGWVYGTHGFANASEVTDRAGRTVKLTSGNTYRFRPDGSEFQVFVRGQTNPFGLAFDPRGDLYTADSHSKPVYLLVPGGFYEGIGKEHDGLGFGPAITADDHGSSAIAGLAHYSAAHFPPEFRDNLFNGNPVTRRLNRTRLDWRGSTPQAARQPDFLASDDLSFRPVQVKLGPDGALWIADFCNPIIGHYEVPLTHPGRDRTHGRIWRIVWRGLDGSVPAPRLPDLAAESTAQLVRRLADPNLVVRSLAAAELPVRADAAAAIPLLRRAAADLIAGADASADPTAALPLLFTLEQLGAPDDALLRRALERPDSAVAHAALRVLAARPAAPADLEAIVARLVAGYPGLGWRLAADLLTRHPQPWAPPVLLGLIGRTPDSDTLLAYALRLALKAHALEADARTLARWTAGNSAAADRLAEICLAVPTPAAAAFLLGYLEKTKVAGPRAGDFAKHAVQNVAPDALATVEPLAASLERAPYPQRLALAEGLAAVAAKPDRPLPAPLVTWTSTALLAGLAGQEPALELRAVNALRPLAWPDKNAPLRRLAAASATREPNRIAALRALDPADPATESAVVEALRTSSSNAVRRAAAELLGPAEPGPAARAALAAAFGNASADLALSLAISLAKSDAGAADLLDLAAAGKVRPALLRHRYVVQALEKRPAALRARADALTRALPPEDARLDAVIAQRLGAAGAHKADRARGAAVFAAHCAACHRFQDTGGNLGPGLDGTSARTVARLVEDILDPSRNVDPAFRLGTATLKNGETRTGMNLRLDGDAWRFTDPADAREIALPAAEVATAAVSALSPMPAAFETLLSEAELFDVIDYLRQPRP